MEPVQGRPRSGVMGSFETAVQEKVDFYRPANEGWGALTIQVELAHERNLKGKKLPSRSTIAHYLKSKGKTRGYKKHLDLPASPFYPPEFAHDLWQMDAEGNKQVRSLGTVCMLNLKDSFSKTYVFTLPLIFEKTCNHPQKEHYQTLLRLAFLEFGMNRRLQIDHESVFFDNHSASPFPTEFHLWLIGLDIEVCFTPKGNPQKQGMVERSHQTMHLQVTAGQTFDNYHQIFERCEQRRHRLNHDIPSRSTRNLPPLVAFPEATKSKRLYELGHEADIFDEKRIQKFLSKGKWFRTVSKDRTVSLGGNVYYLPKAKPKTELEIKFNPYRNTFLFFDADQKFVNSRPAKGLAFNELAGDLDNFHQFFSTLIVPQSSHDFSGQS